MKTTTNLSVNIPKSNTKNALQTLGSLIFVGIGVFLLMKFTEDFNSIKSIVISTFAVIAILFFGFTAYYGIRKFGNKEAGLILDENGITDHSSASSIGFIPWSDITNITRLEIMNIITLMIHVKNPEEYINKAKGLKRKMMQANLNN